MQIQKVPVALWSSLGGIGWNSIYKYRLSEILRDQAHAEDVII